MGTAALLALLHFRKRRCFFSSPAKRGSAPVFSVKKAAALQRCFLSKFSAAAATANKQTLSKTFFYLNFHTLSFEVLTIFVSLCSCYHIISVEQTMLPL